MSDLAPRLWAIAELNRVHPLPERWAWRQRLNGSWCATHTTNGVRCDVWVSAGSLIAMVEGATEPLNFDPPDDVAFAVILASKGMDSLAWMAASLATEAENHYAWAHGKTPTGSRNTADQMRESAAVGDAYTHAVEMLRRGRVQS